MPTFDSLFSSFLICFDNNGMSKIVVIKTWAIDECSGKIKIDEIKPITVIKIVNRIFG